jgi:MinD superfamily P-loop ATPase
MPDAVVASKYIASVNLEKCVTCGKCVSRCQFKARWMENGEVTYDEKRCFGCGVCVSTCPTSAIVLVRRKTVKG